jgi:hypothetical protein
LAFDKLGAGLILHDTRQIFEPKSSFFPCFLAASVQNYMPETGKGAAQISNVIKETP